MRTIGCALVLASVVGGTAVHSQERSLWTAFDTATWRYDIYSLTGSGMDFQFGSVSFEGPSQATKGSIGSRRRSRRSALEGRTGLPPERRSAHLSGAYRVQAHRW